MSQTRRETSFLALSSPAASCEEIKPFFTHCVSQPLYFVLNCTEFLQWDIWMNQNARGATGEDKNGKPVDFRNWISCFSANRKFPWAKKPLICHHVNTPSQASHAVCVDCYHLELYLLRHLLTQSTCDCDIEIWFW